MYRMIDVAMWIDPKVKKLTPLGKLLFLYLITNSHAHVSGIYYLPIAFASLETGIKEKELDTLLDTLSNAGLIKRDRVSDVIWVVKMFDRQGKGAKNDNAAAEQLKSLHKCILIDDFLQFYSHRKIPYTIPYTIPSPVFSYQEQEQEQEQKKKQDQEKSSKPSFTDDDLLTSQWMFSKIVEILPKAKQPDYGLWARDIRLMREVDKKTDEEIREVFSWANSDSFWRANILSPSKLRKQFDRLVLQMGEKQGYRQESDDDDEPEETPELIEWRRKNEEAKRLQFEKLNERNRLAGMKLVQAENSVTNH